MFEPQNCSDGRMMELGLNLADCNNMDGYAQIRNTPQKNQDFAEVLLTAARRCTRIRE